jgi:hypothetical protein
MRVAALDFTALVANGKIPLDKLRLVPEVAQLQFLERIRAEGYSIQQSEGAEGICRVECCFAHVHCTVVAAESPAFAIAWCGMQMRLSDLQDEAARHLVSQSRVVLAVACVQICVAGTLPPGYSILTGAVPRTQHPKNPFSHILLLMPSGMLSMCCLPTSPAGALPPALFNLTRLTSLKLSNANLTGPLPNIANLTALWELELQGNALTGPLPAALPPNLQRMLLGRNKLTGTLPAYTGASALQYLDASFNMLSGNLRPEWVGSLAGLRDVFLQGNNLTGTLPPEVCAAHAAHAFGCTVQCIQLYVTNCFAGHATCRVQ